MFQCASFTKWPITGTFTLLSPSRLEDGSFRCRDACNATVSNAVTRTVCDHKVRTAF